MKSTRRRCRRPTRCCNGCRSCRTRTGNVMPGHSRATVVAPFAAIALALALAGCANPLAKVEIQQPLTARPAPRVTPPIANGAIYQAQAYRPLFEDRFARLVGDTLTVN